MKFDLFKKCLISVQSQKLDPLESHKKMSPLERVTFFNEEQFQIKNYREAGVMMLFYPKMGKTYLALIVRSTYPGVHSSEIGFPGGKPEILDQSLLDTALRETYEEIGVSPSCVGFVKPFSQIYIPPSNFLVSPYMGVSDDELSFRLDLKEVKEVLEFSLSDLLDPESVSKVRMDTSYARNIEVPVFVVNGYFVWGATAMMMSELKQVLINAIQTTGIY